MATRAQLLAAVQKRRKQFYDERECVQVFAVMVVVMFHGAIGRLSSVLVMLLHHRSLSMKAVRRQLEKDLGLAKKQLDGQRDLINGLIDEVCTLGVC